MSEISIDLNKPADPCCEAFKRDPQTHTPGCEVAKRIAEGEFTLINPWQPWDYA